MSSTSEPRATPSLDGYYDPSPTTRLDRSLALTGFFAGGQRQAGRHLAARTGLDFIDLDRWIEHDAGQSLWTIVARGGEEALRRREREQLQRALASTPRGILVLGEGALLDPENRRAVIEETDLIYLHRDLPISYWLLRQHQEKAGNPWQPFVPYPLETLEQLQPLYDRRRQGLEAAPRRLDVGRKHPGVIARELAAELGDDRSQHAGSSKPRLQPNREL